MRVGGYMEQFIAYADSDANFSGDFDGIDSKQDAEIWFLPSITLDNGIKIGANYVQSFGDMNIAISGRWGTGNDHSGRDATIWSGGLNIGFGGFTIGGSYAEQNGNSHRRRNGESYDAGVSYTTGPWGVSFTYFHGENQDNDGPGDEEVDQFLVGLSYDLAKGVNIGGYGAYVDFDEDNNTNNIDGFIIGTGIKIKF